MWFAYYVSLIQAGDNSGLGWKFYLEAAQLVLGYGGWISIGATAVVAIFFILINYSTVLVYLSIPEDIRNRSTLITSLRSTVKKIALYLWGSATLLSVVGMITDWGVYWQGVFQQFYSYQYLLLMDILEYRALVTVWGH
jgi:hypothetical protein